MVSETYPGCPYPIIGASYAGQPRNNTVMFVTKKVENLLTKLENVQQCLVFIDNDTQVPVKAAGNNYFSASDNPQLEYTRFVQKLSEKKQSEDRKLKYHLTKEGYYLGEKVVIGSNSYIEPGCIIGHHVEIGENATILAGTVIKHAIIGNNFLANENGVIGVNGFTMVRNETGNFERIPSLGRVVIGDNVETGTLINISRGSAGDTIIGNNVKLDTLVHVAHDVVIEKNVEIPAGAILGGFVHLQEDVFVGVNASVRNRLTVGKSAIVGMGAVVTKGVEAGTVVVGNPAKPLIK